MHPATLLLALSAPVLGQSAHVVHDKRESAPSPSWHKTNIVAKDLNVPVRIALNQRNLDKAHDYLMEVAHPDSKKYGQHWTAKQVAQAFAPSQESIDNVTKWLETSGISAQRIKVSSDAGIIKFDAKLSELEELLRTKYDVFKHSGSHAESISASEYSVPEELKRHIDYISPTVEMAEIQRRAGISRRSVPNLPAPKQVQQTINKNSTAQCDEAMTPACIKALYSIPDGTCATPGNELAIYAVNDEDWNAENLHDLLGNYTNIPSSTQPKTVGLQGGRTGPGPDQGGSEPDLDLAMSIPIIYPQNAIVYETDINGKNAQVNCIIAPFLDALDKSFCESSAKELNTTAAKDCGDVKSPNVISFSYAFKESLITKAELKRQCNEFLKLGLQGVTVVAGSGDAGIVGQTADDCVFTKGGQEENQALFPASCPYVTTVGATQIRPKGTVKDLEIAVQVNPDLGYFTSGGGWSSVFPRPKYQEAAVEQYLKIAKPDTSKFSYNDGNRGYPDLAANGLNSVAYAGGSATLGGGTSASTPIIASMIVLINEERLKAGKKPLGFLNPLLYSNPDAFKDILVGEAAACNGTKGFSVAKGWDPVTGLGTLPYPSLKKIQTGI